MSALEKLGQMLEKMKSIGTHARRFRLLWIAYYLVRVLGRVSAGVRRVKGIAQIGPSNRAQLEGIHVKSVFPPRSPVFPRCLRYYFTSMYFALFFERVCARYILRPCCGLMRALGYPACHRVPGPAVCSRSLREFRHWREGGRCNRRR